MSPDGRLERLIERARAELPEPGDPTRLIDDLREAGLDGPEALEILQRTSLAWQQLRDMRLERAWQKGYEWFLARAILITGFLMMIYTVFGRPSPILVQGAASGIVIYYLIILALGPQRLRRHKARRAGIREAYVDDLGAYLDGLRPS